MGVVLSPQEKRIQEHAGRIVFSGDLNGRISAIYEEFSDEKAVVDIDRARYFTESFRQTEGEHLTLRWAKALYHVAENIGLYIERNQLLAGRAGGKGKYGLIYPELDGCFLEQFVEQASERTESPFEISDEAIEVIKNEIAPYWNGKTYYEDFAGSLPEDVLRLTYDPADLFTSRYIVNETSSMRSALRPVPVCGSRIPPDDMPSPSTCSSARIVSYRGAVVIPAKIFCTVLSGTPERSEIISLV